jgi:hypothetical protein
MALRVREPAMDERVELQRLVRAETTPARLAQEARAGFRERHVVAAMTKLMTSPCAVQPKQSKRWSASLTMKLGRRSSWAGARREPHQEHKGPARRAADWHRPDGSTIA